jgi:hypothetical protein
MQFVPKRRLSQDLKLAQCVFSTYQTDNEQRCDRNCNSVFPF